MRNDSGHVVWRLGQSASFRIFDSAFYPLPSYDTIQKNPQYEYSVNNLGAGLVLRWVTVRKRILVFNQLAKTPSRNQTPLYLDQKMQSHYIVARPCFTKAFNTQQSNERIKQTRDRHCPEYKH